MLRGRARALRAGAYAVVCIALAHAPPAAPQIAIQSMPDVSPRCELKPDGRFRIQRSADLGQARVSEYLPGAKRLIVASPDRAAALFDITSGARLVELNAPGPGSPGLLAVSPDNELLLWHDDGDRVVQIRRTNSGELIAQPEILQHASVIRFSPDSSRIVAVSDAGLALLEARTAIQVGQTIQVGGGPIRFSTDSARLIAASPYHRGEIAIDVRTGQPAYALPAQDGEEVWFDKEGVRAVAKGDVGWRLIDPSNGNQLAKGSAADEVTYVGGDAYLFVQNGADVRIFDARTGRLAARPGKLATTASGYIDDFGLQVSPDKQTAVTRSPDGTARLWDLARGRGLAELGVFSVDNAKPDEPADVLAKKGITGEFEFTPDGQRLITHDITGRLTIWEARTGRRVATIGLFAGEDRLWLAKDKSYALAIRADDSATLWNTRSGWRIANLGEVSSRSPAFGFVTSPDSRFLLIGDGGRTELWNSETGTRIARREPAVSVDEATFSENGNWLVLRPDSDESVFEIWNARTGGRAGEARPVDSVAFHMIAQEDVLLTRSAAGFALWDLKQGAQAIACRFSDPDLSLMDVFSVEDALLLALNVGGGHSELWRIERR